MDMDIDLDLDLDSYRLLHNQEQRKNECMHSVLSLLILVSHSSQFLPGE